GSDERREAATQVSARDAEISQSANLRDLVRPWQTSSVVGCCNEVGTEDGRVSDRRGPWRPKPAAPLVHKGAFIERSSSISLMGGHLRRAGRIGDCVFGSKKLPF